MRARDIMVSPVVTVKPDTTIAALAQLMSEKRISGVPVVNNAGDMVGIVSETDLIHRAETGTQRRRKWWMQMLIDSDSLARDFIKANSTRTGDIMSPYVVSVTADARLRHVADVLESSEIKRVPVTDGGRLVGIITRGDLVRALAATQPHDRTEGADDATLQKRIKDRLAAQAWLNLTYVSVTVNNGQTEVTGFVVSQSQHKALMVLLKEAGAADIKDNIKVGAIPLYAV